MSLADNVDFLRRLHRPHGTAGQARVGSPLVEVTDFGSNPGDLRMLAYVPEDAEPQPALVVVLHGCTQKAAAYDIGTGWSELARRYRFVLLMPEQKTSNNGNTCFNWFNPDDLVRDSGEPLSIRQMIAKLSADHDIDPDRIFITGLSAGGAMASVMLATYPEVFAAGAIIAGLPYGVAHNLQDAIKAMFRAPEHSADELGDYVRAATPHAGPWPRVSVWHGSSDRTVNPGNAAEIVRQWTNIHGLPEAPMSEVLHDSIPRQVWWDVDGTTLVESYTVSGMGHGAPIGPGGDDAHYGQGGAYLLDAGVSSSWHAAEFFGLTQTLPSGRDVVPATAATVQPGGDGPEPSHTRVRDISTVITRALAAAGLVK